MKLSPLIILALLLALSCRQESSQDGKQKEWILEEIDLIPEGITVDEQSGDLYLGATYKRKILKISPDGELSDFIPQEQNGMYSPVGMEVDEQSGLLWSCMAHANEVMPLIHPLEDQDWLTSITSFDLATAKPIGNYPLHHEKAFLNDLIINSEGVLFATESVNNGIYKLAPKEDSLQLWLEPQGVAFLNGICLSPDEKFLFVSAVQGILKVDIQSKDYNLLEMLPGVSAGGIDGLSFYRNRLIGHEGSHVSQFYLNEDWTLITKTDTLDSGPEFDASTTGALYGDEYIFIVNSQISSGVNYETRSIKPADSLEQVIIRSISLDPNKE